MPQEKRIYFLAERGPTPAELRVIHAENGQGVGVIPEGMTRGREDHELITHTFYGPLAYGEKIVVYAPSHGHHHRVREALAHLPHPHLPSGFTISFHHPRQR